MRSILRWKSIGWKEPGAPTWVAPTVTVAADHSAAAPVAARSVTPAKAPTSGCEPLGEPTRIGLRFFNQPDKVALDLIWIKSQTRESSDSLSPSLCGAQIVAKLR